MLWVDKYRPIKIDHLDLHQNLNQILKSLNSIEMPHLLFYGPSGSGKKTRIQALLHEIYPKFKIKLETREFNFNRKFEIQVVSSPFHIEITPSDVGIYDKIIIQEMIKEICQTRQVDQKGFKIIVFNEADGMTRDAQAALRRTMEKYMANCRIILCCNNTSKIIDPIKSRCLMLRVPSPTTSEIAKTISSVVNKEGLEIPMGLARRIAVASQGNLRKALLMVEAMRVQQYPFVVDQELPCPDYQVLISEIAKQIVREQSPKCLLDVRSKFYQLLSHCIPADVIIKQLTFGILANIDSALKCDVIQQAAEYEHRIRLGSKDVFHLEAFAAKIMSMYSNYLADEITV